MSKNVEAVERNIKYLKQRFNSDGIVNKAGATSFKSLDQARHHVGITRGVTTWDEQLKPFVK